MTQRNPLYPSWYTEKDIQKSINDVNECLLYKYNMMEKQKKRSDNREYNFSSFDVSIPTIDKNIVDYGGYYIGKIN